jgi:transposase
MLFMPRTRPPYPPEFRREAVQLVRVGRTIKDVAESLGCSEQSLQTWVKREQLDRHERDDGLTSAEREELKELRKRVKRLSRSARSSSEPRFSSQRRPRPGECLPDHLGGEGQFPSLCDV